MADAIHIRADAVPENASIRNFERWDSLAHLQLLLAIEERLGRPLNPDEAVRIESLVDVTAIIGER